MLLSGNKLFVFLTKPKKNEGEKRRAEKVRSSVVAERAWRKSPIHWRELEQWINVEFPNREGLSSAAPKNNIAFLWEHDN